jgi:FO synthase
LAAGANDFGGTLMDESISRSAGASFGEEITAAEMVQIIRDADRQPVRRNTLYEQIERYTDHEPASLEPLKARGYDPVNFIRHRTAKPPCNAGASHA